MKKLKGSALNLYNSLYLTIVGFAIYYCFDKSIELLSSILIVLASCLIGYIFLNHYFHYFIYDENEIIVRNSWNPFTKRVISMSSIQSIKLSAAPFIGYNIIITFNGKKKGFPVGNIAKYKLQQFVLEVESYLQVR